MAPPCSTFGFRLAFAFAVLGATWATDADAQPHAVLDGDGIWRWTDRLLAAQSFPKDGDAVLQMGLFEVTFEDRVLQTGVGFDDPELGEERVQTLANVLEYISAVLDVPGAADLWVFASQTDGRGPLAAAGPLLIPTPGFQGGFVFDHLTTGVDSAADSPDGTVSVDFGYDWNSDGDAPLPFERDLHTALLHEVTHALGFFSLLGPDGRSELLNVGDIGVFSLVDARLLRGSEGSRLVNDDAVSVAEADDLTSRDLVFRGERTDEAFLGLPPMFTPRVFIDGTSISHWDPVVGEEAVMLPALAQGDARREWADWEVQAVADLGYSVVACGDGFVAGDELCDDGNLRAGDECDPQCALGPGPDPAIDLPMPDPEPPRIDDDSPLPDPGDPDRPMPAPTEPLPELPSEPPPASALDSSGGCEIAIAGRGGAEWFLPMMILWLARRRFRRPPFDSRSSCKSTSKR